MTDFNSSFISFFFYNTFYVTKNSIGLVRLTPKETYKGLETVKYIYGKRELLEILTNTYTSA